MMQPGTQKDAQPSAEACRAQTRLREALASAPERVDQKPRSGTLPGKLHSGLCSGVQRPKAAPETAPCLLPLAARYWHGKWEGSRAGQGTELRFKSEGC